MWKPTAASDSSPAVWRSRRTSSVRSTTPGRGGASVGQGVSWAGRQLGGAQLRKLAAARNRRLWGGEYFVTKTDVA
jgi:hypothetical protein